MQRQYEDMTIALAGIIQATSLVRQLAQTGKIPEEVFNTSIYSIFQTDPMDIASVYTNLHGVKWGLEKLAIQMDKNPDRVVTRYMLSVIHLQKKLSRSTLLSNNLAKRMDQVKKQVEYFSLTHPTVIANLADIYLNTLSTFNFRIVIWGSQRILSVHQNMEKIRALLLAGVRSAVLWRQMGGSRWQFLFSRAKIKATAETLLKSLDHDPT